MTRPSAIGYFIRKAAASVPREADGRIVESTPQPVSDDARHRARVRRRIEAFEERQRDRDDDADLGW